MTSTMSRRRHNYISRLGIPCRINCIVSACPLYDSVSIRGAWWRRHSQCNPSEADGVPQPLSAIHPARPMLVPRPLHSTLVDDISSFVFGPRGALIINKAFSRTRAVIVQSALAGRIPGAFWMLQLIVIYAWSLCQSRDFEINVVWCISASLLFIRAWTRGDPTVCLNCLHREKAIAIRIDGDWIELRSGL